MIRQDASGLAFRLYADNRNERARTPLLLAALRTNRVESIPFGSRAVRVQTVNAKWAVKNSAIAVESVFKARVSARWNRNRRCRDQLLKATPPEPVAPAPPARPPSARCARRAGSGTAYRH